MKRVLAILLALVLALGLCACGRKAAPGEGGGAPVINDGDVIGEGKNSFTLEIVDGDGKKITATINCDDTVVGDALQAYGIITGEEAQYGLYIKSVNGISADYETDGTYWSFYVNGEYAVKGVDMTEIENGATYTLAVEKM